VINIVVFASVSCLTMSLTVKRALSVVAVAPARRMAWKAIANGIRRQQAHDASDADTPGSQRAGRCVYLFDHLPVRSRCRTWDIDERNAIQIRWIDVCEEQVEHAHIGDVDVGERASKGHGDLGQRWSSDVLRSAVRE
jgi:hypothetical protein